MNIKHFRNHGDFAKWARKSFSKYDDPTLEWLKNLMNNYQIIDEFVYNRDIKSGSRAMRVFLFRRMS